MYFFFSFIFSLSLAFLFASKGSSLLELKEINIFLFYLFSAFIEESIKILPLIIGSYFVIKPKQVKLYLGGVFGFIFLESYYYYFNFLMIENINLFNIFYFLFERIFVALIHISFFILFYYFYKTKKRPFYTAFFIIVFIHTFYNIGITFISN